MRWPNHDTSNGSNAFEPRRHVHAVTEQIVILDDYVAEVDPNADRRMFEDGPFRSDMARWMSTA